MPQKTNKQTNKKTWKKAYEILENLMIIQVFRKEAGLSSCCDLQESLQYLVVRHMSSLDTVTKGGIKGAKAI